MEHMSKNYLSRSLYQSLWLYGLLQVVTGTGRVDSLNRYVTRPSVYQKSYSVVVIVVTGVMYGYIQFRYIDQYIQNRNLYLLATVFLIAHFSVSVINLLHVRFINNEKNVNFIINMQRIDRCMRIDRYKSFNAVLGRINNASVLLSVAIFFFMIACSLYEGALTVVIGTVAGVLGEGVLVQDLVLCSNLMSYFSLRIRFINGIIVNHLKHHAAFTFHKQFFDLNNCMKKLAEICHDFKSCDTDVYLNEIMEGFHKYQIIYRLQMLFFTCKFIIGLALYFGIVLLAIGGNLLAYLNVLIMGSFAVSNMILSLLICIRCEIFIRDAKETKNLCIAVMSVYVGDGPLREKARRMLRIIEAKPPRFSVYEIFHMEAAFVLKLLSIITAIVVTLLQFAFV